MSETEGIFLTKLHIAKALKARGFRVFPVTPGAKAPPLLADWPNRAAKTEAEVEVLWAAMPDANVAIHCAGLVVVDVDIRNGGGISLETLNDIYHIPVTLTTRTPSGGRHLFFRLAEGQAVSNSAGKLGKGIDIKTTGGYVVAPGSDTEAGRYHFEADVPIAEAPTWLLDLLGTRTPKATAPASSTVAPPETVEQARQWLAEQSVGGGRSYANACGLRDRGLSVAQAREVFAEHDPRPDALDQVDHAYRYAQGAPGAKAVVESDLPVVQNVGTYAQVPTLRHIRSFKDLSTGDYTPPPYVVKGLLSQRSHAVVFGPPKQGKSANVMDLALHVSAGRPWRGHRVRQGAVLYLAFEGVGGIEGRVRAWGRQYNAPDELPFYAVSANYNLADKADRAALGADVRTALGDVKPVLLVVDTVARALARMQGDENSAKDMGILNDAIGALIAHSEACVLLIHHSGKNAARGARGSNSLLAAVDTEIEISDGTMRVTAQRDLPPSEPTGFSCLPVVVGVDAEGDEITSVVAIEVEAPKTERILGNARLAFDALCRLSPNNAPVSPERWSEVCMEFLTGKTRKQSFYKLKTTLLDRGYIVCDDAGIVTRRLE